MGSLDHKNTKSPSNVKNLAGAWEKRAAASVANGAETTTWSNAAASPKRSWRPKTVTPVNDNENYTKNSQSTDKDKPGSPLPPRKSTTRKRTPQRSRSVGKLAPGRNSSKVSKESTSPFHSSYSHGFDDDNDESWNPLILKERKTKTTTTAPRRHTSKTSSMDQVATTGTTTTTTATKKKNNINIFQIVVETVYSDDEEEGIEEISVHGDAVEIQIDPSTLSGTPNDQDDDDDDCNKTKAKTAGHNGVYKSTASKDLFTPYPPHYKTSPHKKEKSIKKSPSSSATVPKDDPPTRERLTIKKRKSWKQTSAAEAAPSPTSTPMVRSPIPQKHKSHNVYKKKSLAASSNNNPTITKESDYKVNMAASRVASHGHMNDYDAVPLSSAVDSTDDAAFQKYSISELKKLAKEHGADISGCLEKSEIIVALKRQNVLVDGAKTTAEKKSSSVTSSTKPLKPPAADPTASSVLPTRPETPSQTTADNTPVSPVPSTPKGRTARRSRSKSAGPGGRAAAPRRTKSNYEKEKVYQESPEPNNDSNSKPTGYKSPSAVKERKQEAAGDHNRQYESSNNHKSKERKSRSKSPTRGRRNTATDSRKQRQESPKRRSKSNGRRTATTEKNDESATADRPTTPTDTGAPSSPRKGRRSVEKQHQHSESDNHNASSPRRRAPRPREEPSANHNAAAAMKKPPPTKKKSTKPTKKASAVKKKQQHQPDSSPPPPSVELESLPISRLKALAKESGTDISSCLERSEIVNALKNAGVVGELE